MQAETSSLPQPFSGVSNKMALVSLILSCSFVLAGPLVSIPGIICGHMGLRDYRQGNGGRGMALAGIIVGWIGLALGMAVVGLVVWMWIATGGNTGPQP